MDLSERDPDKLWLTLLETEDALIPDGLHVVGRPIRRGRRLQGTSCASWRKQTPTTRRRIEHLLRQETELTGLMRALSGVGTSSPFRAAT